MAVEAEKFLPAQGDIQQVEQNMIQDMFIITEIAVNDVMMPKIDVVTVEKKITCQDAKQTSVENSHIRLPVYDQRFDRVTGVLHTLELLDADTREPITSYIPPDVYAPQDKSIKNLMSEFRSAGSDIAIVVDEFGDTEGIVTIERIMEEVVEDLEDECDGSREDSDWIRRLNENDYQVSARFKVDE